MMNRGHAFFLGAGLCLFSVAEAKSAFDSYAFDLLLAAESAYFVYGYEENPEIYRRSFPSQAMDVYLRTKLHGAQATSELTPGEEFWAELSHFGIGALLLPPLLELSRYETSGERRHTLVRAFTLNNALTSTLKHSIRRPRPHRFFEKSAQHTVDSVASFPSGHASTAFMLATVFSVGIDPAAWQVYAVYATATLVSLGRVMADKHYVSDVLAGGCVGIASGLLAHYEYLPAYLSLGYQEQGPWLGMQLFF